MKKMSRKRFIKLAMGVYLMDRNSAELVADMVPECGGGYTENFFILGVHLLARGVELGRQPVKWRNVPPGKGRPKKGWTEAKIEEIGGADNG